MSGLWGKLTVKIDGTIQWAFGDWDVDMGIDKLEARMAADGRLAGYVSEPRPPMAKGKILYHPDLSVSALFATQDATLQIDFSNGKTVVLKNATFTGDGKIGAKSGEIDVEFTAESAEEIAA